MFEFMLGAVIGAVIGWNILPQPAWVASIYARFFSKES